MHVRHSLTGRYVVFSTTKKRKKERNTQAVLYRPVLYTIPAYIKIRHHRNALLNPDVHLTRAPITASVACHAQHKIRRAFTIA